MICNFKSHWRAEIMPSIWELSTWALQTVNQPKLCSILVASTLPSPPPSVMIKLQVTSNSRNMTHSQVLSFKETNLTRDARPRHTTCINLTLIRFSQKHLQSSHTDQPNSRDSSGKIMLASSHSTTPQEKQVWFNLRCNWKTINAHISNSLPCTNLKDLETTQTVS